VNHVSLSRVTLIPIQLSPFPLNFLYHPQSATGSSCMEQKHRAQSTRIKIMTKCEMHCFIEKWYLYNYFETIFERLSFSYSHYVLTLSSFFSLNYFLSIKRYKKKSCHKNYHQMVIQILLLFFIISFVLHLLEYSSTYPWFLKVGIYNAVNYYEVWVFGYIRRWILSYSHRFN